MSARDIVLLLGGHWHGAYGLAMCPVHDDGTTPSLKISDDPGRRDGLDVHCFAGCDWRPIKNRLVELGALDGTLEQTERREPLPPRRADNANLGPALEIWDRCQPIGGTRAERYLVRRGLKGPFPHTLRYHPALKHAPTGLQFPAMVAKISGADGSLVAIQRTFLAIAGAAKANVSEPRMTLGAIGGGAVRLGGGGKVLGIAEGIETGLAAQQLHRLPVWAAVGCRLDRIAVPAAVERVVIFADNDEPGLAAAAKAAERLKEQSIPCEIKPPSSPGDWNDALKGAGDDDI